MRVLFVADGRSPIALNWIRYFVERGDDVFLASTFACSPGMPLSGLEITPVAFSGTNKSKRASSGSSSLGIGWRTAVRRTLGPLTVARASRRLRAVADRVRPDLVHAMRIPFEGMLAADAYGAAPLLCLSGAMILPSMRQPRFSCVTTRLGHCALQTRCMQTAAATSASDASGALMRPSPPSFVPGGGGIRTDVFHPPRTPLPIPLSSTPGDQENIFETTSSSALSHSSWPGIQMPDSSASPCRATRTRHDGSRSCASFTP